MSSRLHYESFHYGIKQKETMLSKYKLNQLLQRYAIRQFDDTADFTFC